MRTYEMSRQAMEAILQMELRPDHWNDIEVKDDGYEISVRAFVDGYFELGTLEVYICDKEGNELDVDNDQYTEIREDFESVLYEMAEDAKAEERWINYQLNHRS